MPALPKFLHLTDRVGDQCALWIDADGEMRGCWTFLANLPCRDHLNPEHRATAWYMEGREDYDRYGFAVSYDDALEALRPAAAPIRLLVTPKALKAQCPCAERWKVYRAQFKGRKPHALADLLTRPDVSDYHLHEDFRWVLSALAFPVVGTASPIARELLDHITTSWRQSNLLPHGSYLPHPWVVATACHYESDTPLDWKERALGVIAEMEREETAKRSKNLSGGPAYV